MINIKLRILKKLLEECINNINAGNSNHDEKELDEIIKDPYSEEAAYLTGNIGQLMFPKAKRFLCKCYCK